MTAAIRDMPGLVDALRKRRDELNISHETIDSIAGLQAGYCSKLLAPRPIKNLGPMSLEAMLGALGLAIVVVEDEDAKGRVCGRWIKRKRPQKLPPQASAASIDNEVPAILPITLDLQAKLELRERMRMLGKLGAAKGASKGGKRRAKMLKKKDRQEIASHAARIRWAKAKEAARFKDGKGKQRKAERDARHA